MEPDTLFCEYFSDWIDTYKAGAVREATLAKYRMAENWIKKLMPDVKCSELTKHEYQSLMRCGRTLSPSGESKPAQNSAPVKVRFIFTHL